MNDIANVSAYREIKKILTGLYGVDDGKLRYEYLVHSAETYLQNRTNEQIEFNSQFNRNIPYDSLKGKIFAIAYPDNIYTDDEYTLRTLKIALEKYFPEVKGIHILPERTMSHSDVWPQDFFSIFSVKAAQKIVSSLLKRGMIDKNRYVTSLYSEQIDIFFREDLEKEIGKVSAENLEKVRVILDSAWNSHFNDGGFSQKTRALVDPRFGENKDLMDITRHFSTMLDYVVNHLDVDNEYLENFRKGNNDGDAFLILYRDKYKQLLGDRILEKTFRPRPFPLFTGLRKYPIGSLDGENLSQIFCAAQMNRIFTANELEPLDSRLVLFLSIYFKIDNDQGLTSEDKRIFSEFEQFTEESGIEISSFWKESDIQTNQKKFNRQIIGSMDTFLKKMGFNTDYADLFMNDCDHIFGREFYVYTTFSESQADVNPLSFDGYKMIIDDLFHLLSSGSLSMMRMDAIKYLWKEIGSKNFDMEEGNQLIKVIRLLMDITSPSTLPLDEINSPDPVVYAMSEGGGFAYLFGQVNAVPASFNIGSLQPLVRFHKTMKKFCPKNLLPFVMLSTHDGRSVQGLGVQRSDGHVSIEQFYNLKDTVESRGGKPKFRSVPRGEISGDTFRKVFIEAGFENSITKLYDLFDLNLIKKEDLFRLKDQGLSESDLLEEISLKLDLDVRTLMGSAAIDYFVQWIIYGKTAYELCCTTRCAFTVSDSDGNSITAAEEAQRLALAQLFVLTQGQDVPAIYLNDLLGLENDMELFGITGKPRDLNRHKNKLSEMIDLMGNDLFTKVYTKRLNKLLKLRADDEAFYPGSENYQFEAISDQVFMNHAWAGGNHSLILGNIVNQSSRVQFDVQEIYGFDSEKLTDQLTGNVYSADRGAFQITLDPFGYVWLK